MAPLLTAALLLARQGSVRGLLLWLGVLGYGAYNYMYYMLGAALNAFFPLYLAALILSGVTLILAPSRINVTEVAASFRPKTPVRIIGGYLVFVATGLTFVWMGVWAAYVFAGRPTPVEPEAFRLVAALDMTTMVPVLAKMTREEKTFVPLEDLAVPYARNLVEHGQASDRQSTSPSTRFLNTCRRFSRDEIAEAELVNTTVRFGFANVLDAFHVVIRKVTPVRFFVDERRSRKGIVLTYELLGLEETIQYNNLGHEVEARWRLVETAWALDISPRLLVAEYDPTVGDIYVEESSGTRRVGVISREELREKLAGVDSERDRLRKALQEAQRRQEALERIDREREVVLKTFSKLCRYDLLFSTPEQRRTIFQALGLKAEVDLVNPDGGVRIMGVFNSYVADLLPFVEGIAKGRYQRGPSGVGAVLYQDKGPWSL